MKNKQFVKKMRGSTERVRNKSEEQEEKKKKNNEDKEIGRERGRYKKRA